MPWYPDEAERIEALGELVSQHVARRRHRLTQQGPAAWWGPASWWHDPRGLADQWVTLARSICRSRSLAP